MSAPRWVHVAEWLRSGLQNRSPRFNSGRGLHSNALVHLISLAPRSELSRDLNELGAKGENIERASIAESIPARGLIS